MTSQQGHADRINAYWAVRGVKANAQVKETISSFATYRTTRATVVSDLTGWEPDRMADLGFSRASAALRQFSAPPKPAHGSGIGG